MIPNAMLDQALGAAHCASQTFVRELFGALAINFHDFNELMVDIKHRYTVDDSNVLYHNWGMATSNHTLQDKAVSLLDQHGMLRLSEFIKAGVTAATISRMEQKGLLVQLSRGLYQLHDAPLEAHHSLAVAAKLVPEGVICLDSALAFHELTDRIPHYTWVGIGPREWRPRITNPPIQIDRFGPRVFNSGIDVHVIERVRVKIYGPAKTIVDLFRNGLQQQALYASKTGITDAIRGMKEALRLRKATPAEIARFAVEAAQDERVWKKLQPYLEALTIDA